MPLINIGTTFTDSEEYAKKERDPVPDGPYTMRVISIEPGTAKSGNPKLTFLLEVVENPNPDYNGKKIYYNCPLPANGQQRGIGFLVAITKALGRAWAGMDLNTDEMVGLTCKANVNTSDRGWNQIASFV